MNEWHDFFLAQAGAAGVLTGLVFVGVSINLQKIVSDPSSGLAGRAAEALILLVAVLTASVLLLELVRARACSARRCSWWGSPPGGGSWPSSGLGCGTGGP